MPVRGADRALFNKVTAAVHFRAFCTPMTLASQACSCSSCASPCDARPHLVRTDQASQSSAHRRRATAAADRRQHVGTAMFPRHIDKAGVRCKRQQRLSVSVPWPSSSSSSSSRVSSCGLVFILFGRPLPRHLSRASGCGHHTGGRVCAPAQRPRAPDHADRKRIAAFAPSHHRAGGERCWCW